MVLRHTVFVLQSVGFVERGQGLHFAKDGRIALNGELPIATFGGLKARGHPVSDVHVCICSSVCMSPCKVCVF